MRIFARVPLPWLNLIHDKPRLVVRVLAMTFAVFLLFAELGFYNALLDGAVQLIEEFNGQLIVVSQAHYALNIKEPFPRRCLAQARAVPGVRDAFPVYLERAAAQWKDTGAAERQRSPSHPIRVIAFNPDQPVLKDAELKAVDVAALKIPFNILLDRKAKEKSYGKIGKDIDRELAGHSVHVAGLFTLGIDFANEGNAIMSDQTYARLFAGDVPLPSVLELADVGVIQIAPQADAQTVCQILRETLPGDVRVLTKEDFIQREKAYWRNTTPMGFIFFLGLCVGFIVGAVICYQIISTDVAEHLPQFATLKAMGYRDAFLNSVVLCEALWLAVLGLVPGLGLSWLLYRLLDFWVGLPMRMTPLRILLIFGITTVMCLGSGLLALRKVKTADPAEVFE